MSSVIKVTRAELLERREKILESLGVTLNEYYDHADNSELSDAEWDARDDLDTVAFLLGEKRFVD